MRSVIVLICAIVLSTATNAQKDKPSITVTGSSEIKVAPDQGVLVLTIEHKAMDISEAISRLNEKTSDVTSQIVSVGMKREDVKTTNFQVIENRFYRMDHYVDSGYIATQSVEIEFPYNSETISKILETFSSSRTDFKINFNFKLSDALREKVQNDLMTRAILDAGQKAELIASTAKVRLKKVIDISYGHPYRIYETRQTMDYAMAGNQAAKMEGFTPQDLQLTDEVMVTWSICD